MESTPSSSTSNKRQSTPPIKPLSESAKKSKLVVPNATGLDKRDIIEDKDEFETESTPTLLKGKTGLEGESDVKLAGEEGEVEGESEGMLLSHAVSLIATTLSLRGQVQT